MFVRLKQNIFNLNNCILLQEKLYFNCNLGSLFAKNNFYQVFLFNLLLIIRIHYTFTSACIEQKKVRFENSFKFTLSLGKNWRMVSGCIQLKTKSFFFLN